MFREVTLPDGVPGHLYLHSMPGRNETLADFLAAAKQADLNIVVCLTSLGELRSKSPAYFALRAANAAPFELEDFPIPDLSVPDQARRAEFVELATGISEELRSGEHVLIHCRMGIGRTGTLATCVLITLGVGEASALQLVRSAGSRPETAEQRELVAWYAGAGMSKDDSS